MKFEIRKLYKIIEETRIEGGKPVTGLCQVGVVAAVVANPFAGHFTDDLLPLTRSGLELGRMLADEMVQLLGGPHLVSAYSKAAIVGTAGEVEHGAAILHTYAFGDVIRKAAAGEAPVPSTEKRGPTGASIDLSIKGKKNQTPRPFHQTFTLQIADAPFPDEMIVIVAGATMGRPQSRIVTASEEKQALGLV